MEWEQDNNVFLPPTNLQWQPQLWWLWVWGTAVLVATLRLNHVSLEDSGTYVCQATLEIPKLQEAKDNRTKVLVEAGMTGDEVICGLGRF